MVEIDELVKSMCDSNSEEDAEQITDALVMLSSRNGDVERKLFDVQYNGGVSAINRWWARRALERVWIHRCELEAISRQQLQSN